MASPKQSPLRIYSLSVILLVNLPTISSASANDADSLAAIAKLRQTDLDRAISSAAQIYAATAKPGLEEQHWRASLLYADLLLDRSGNPDRPLIDRILDFTIPSGKSRKEAQARLAYLHGLLEQRAGNSEKAQRFYDESLAISPEIQDPCLTAALLDRHAQISLRLQAFTNADQSLTKAAPYAAACSDTNWEVLRLFVKGNLFLNQYRYEPALPWFRQALRFPSKNTANLWGNVALCEYNLGNPDAALHAIEQTDTYYQQFGKAITPLQLRDWGEDVGHRARFYLSQGKYQAATRFYEKALSMARDSKNHLYELRWLAELTSLNIETGNFKLAESLNQQVRANADPLKDTWTIAAAQLNEVRLARLQNDFLRAQKALLPLTQVVHRHAADLEPKLLWETHIESAQVLSGLNRFGEAKREFDTALKVTDATRKSIVADNNRLTYFAQLLNVYHTYVDFLAAHNQPEAALRIAEQGHARLLAEKLNKPQNLSSRLNFTAIARAKRAVILSYSVTQNRTFLWVTTAAASKMFVIGLSQAKLTKLIDRHNEPILQQRSLAEDLEGQELYKTLIAPAAPSIPEHSRVIVIPDGPLSNLNFETLIPPGPKPRYWLQSVVITVAPSLVLLDPKAQRPVDPKLVLGVGGAVPSPESPRQRPGLTEVLNLRNLYGVKCHLLTNEKATPDAFLNYANLPGYSLIHLSAHAIPNEQSPLDSYVELSKETGGEYRLYAHDLAKLHLNANLVTLSACRSAGATTVPGEGLVGITWAVLRSGAGNVVASLWNVSESATGQLMDQFYRHLNTGEPPDQALHSAKLAIAAKSNSIPYQWAAFQLYSR